MEGSLRGIRSGSSQFNKRASVEHSSGEKSLNPKLAEVLSLPPGRTIPLGTDPLLDNITARMHQLSKANSAPLLPLLKQPLSRSSLAEVSAASSSPVPEDPRALLGELTEGLGGIIPEELAAVQLTDDSMKLLFAEHLLISLNVSYAEARQGIRFSSSREAMGFLIDFRQRFITQSLPMLKHYFKDEFCVEVDSRIFDALQDTIVKKVLDHFFMNKFFNDFFIPELAGRLGSQYHLPQADLALNKNIYIFSFNRVGSSNPDFLTASYESDCDFNLVIFKELIDKIVDRVHINPQGVTRFITDTCRLLIDLSGDLIHALQLKIEVGNFTFESAAEVQKKINTDKKAGLFYSALQGEFTTLYGESGRLDVFLKSLVPDFDHITDTIRGKIKLIKLIRKLIELYYLPTSLKESMGKIETGASDFQTKLRHICESLNRLGLTPNIAETLRILDLPHLVGSPIFGRLSPLEQVQHHVINSKTNLCRIGDILLHGFVSKLLRALKREVPYAEKPAFYTWLNGLIGKRHTISPAQALINIGVLLQNISVTDLSLANPGLPHLPEVLDSLYTYTSGSQFVRTGLNDLSKITPLIIDAFQSGLLSSEQVSFEELRNLGLHENYPAILRSEVSSETSSPVHVRRSSLRPGQQLVPPEILARLREDFAEKLSSLAESSEELLPPPSSESALPLSSPSTGVLVPTPPLSLDKVFKFLLDYLGTGRGMVIVSKLEERQPDRNLRAYVLSCISYLLQTRLTRVSQQIMRQLTDFLNSYERALGTEIPRLLASAPPPQSTATSLGSTGIPLVPPVRVESSSVTEPSLARSSSVSPPVADERQSGSSSLPEGPAMLPSDAVESPPAPRSGPSLLGTSKKS